MQTFGNFLRIIIVVVVVCGVAAGSLSLVNQITSEPIAKNKALADSEAMKLVQPAATSFQALFDEKNPPPGPKAWAAKRDQELIGHVIGVAPQGYAGPIDLMFGVDLQNKITGVKIITQSETPGLGAKIAALDFTNQYQGKSAGELFLKKDDPVKGTIDAISGATISPRAVTKGIREGLAAFLTGGVETGDAATGATKEAKK